MLCLFFRWYRISLSFHVVELALEPEERAEERRQGETLRNGPVVEIRFGVS